MKKIHGIVRGGKILVRVSWKSGSVSIIPITTFLEMKNPTLAEAGQR